MSIVDKNRKRPEKCKKQQIKNIN